MLLLRRQLNSVFASNFGGMISFDEAMDFRRNQTYVKQLYDLSIKNVDYHLVSEDKVFYMNVAFGLRFLNLPTDLNVREVRKFCQELVEDQVNYAEPYFFYLLLFWPNEYADSKMNQKTFNMLRNCQSELGKYEAENSFNGGARKRFTHSRSRTIFFLSSGNDLHRVKSPGDVPLKQLEGVVRLKGTVDERKNIDCFLTEDGRWTLKLRAVSLANRTTTKGQNVTFNVGFGFGGAVAYNVRTEEEEIEAARRKELTDQANAASPQYHAFA
jgi:hypothetical protein